jgi:hypothetical protein
MRLWFPILVPFPTWFLVGSLAVVSTIYAVERATDKPYAACDARDEPPLYRAELAPGERVLLGDVTVVADTNASRPLPAGAIRVALCGSALIVTVLEGFSIRMASLDGGLAGDCGNLDGRPHRAHCDVRSGSTVRVSALTLTTPTPMP